MTNEIIAAADKAGLLYASMLAGEADMTEVAQAANELTDRLRDAGCANSHYLNAALLTGIFQTHKTSESGPKDDDALISRVYALFSKETGLTKIGYTKRLDRRIREISGMSPDSLEVIRHWSGGRSDESGLHYRFRKFRVHGEWFDLSAEVRDQLATLESLV